MEPATTLLLELAKEGILALLLAVALIAYFRKDSALAASYEKRIEDNNKLAAVIESTNARGKALEITSENRSKVIESVGEATRATADAIRSQASNLDHLKATVERNGQAVSVIREDIDELRRVVLDSIRVPNKPRRTTRRVAKGSS